MNARGLSITTKIGGIALTMLISLVLAIILTSCAGKSLVQRGDPFSRIETIPEEKGLVYLYRKSNFYSKLSKFNIQYGKIVGGDDLKREYRDGKPITILYDEGWVTYFTGGKHEYFREKFTGVIGRTHYFNEDRSVLPEAHEILVAEEAGFPIISEDKYLITLINKSYFPVFLEPGRYMFHTVMRERRDVALDVEPGKTYYIKGSVGLYPDFSIKQVADDEAQQEIIKCDLVTLKEEEKIQSDSTGGN
jgi:hypothetical protein